MKRWNKKGSVHAINRMSELRERKTRLKIRQLQREFNEMVGAKTFYEAMCAMQSRGWTTRLTLEQRIEWFETQLKAK